MFDKKLRKYIFYFFVLKKYLILENIMIGKNVEEGYVFKKKIILNC